MVGMFTANDLRNGSIDPLFVSRCFLYTGLCAMPFRSLLVRINPIEPLLPRSAPAIYAEPSHDPFELVAAHIAQSVLYRVANADVFFSS